MSLEGLTREAASLVLETSRMGGMMMVAPLPWKEAPARMRAIIAVIMAFVVHGGAAMLAQGIESLDRVAIAVPFELLVGVAIGLVVRWALSAVEIAADTLAPLFGLGIAGIFDPHTQVSDTVLARLISLLALMIAVILGLHRVVIGSVIASFRVLPPGSVTDPSLATLPLVRMSANALALGFRLALPVLAVLLMTQLALAFVSRAAPAMQIFSIGFAVSMIVGAMALLIALPEMMSEVSADFSDVGARIESILGVLVQR